MKFYQITDEPIKIYGLAVADSEKRAFWRLSKSIMDAMPQYDFLGKRAVGGRVRFCTNSQELTVRMTLAQAKEDVNIPLSGSAGADIYFGKGKDAVYMGYVAPSEHVEEEVTVEKTFQMSGKMELVTINLPRNDHLLGMEIGIDDAAKLEAAPDYTLENPIVFYGSSITEGGCASRVGNAYTSILCRWLDADYYNFGFSGLAKGEPEFAKYISELQNMSAFIYDYDHNAPDIQHLKDTHEAFFKIIRERHPQLPIIILSRPDTDKDKEDARNRRNIIYQTYHNALEAGDRRVCFLDGGMFFGITGRMECTVDGTHPNALGFMRMAEAIYALLKEWV